MILIKIKTNTNTQTIRFGATACTSTLTVKMKMAATLGASRIVSEASLDSPCDHSILGCVVFLDSQTATAMTASLQRPLLRPG